MDSFNLMHMYIIGDSKSAINTIDSVKLIDLFEKQESLTATSLINNVDIFTIHRSANDRPKSWWNDF